MIKTKILIATGGTGGHVFPAIGLANNLINNNYDVRLTMDERGLTYLGNNNTIYLTKIPSSPIIKKNIFIFLKSVLTICYSIIKSIFLMLSNRPNIILGMGGYASFPICIAAIILKIKFIIYENNLILGKANRYLLPFAKKIFVAYKELEGVQEKEKKKVIEVGNIIREEIIHFQSQNISRNKIDNFNILILGGSQGAKVFAEKLPQVFKKMKNDGMLFKVFQQCQLNQTRELSNFYKNENINFEVFNFTNEITNYYSKANLVITRSGASALGELINVNIPFIAVPLPTSADNHQFKNARYYEEKGMCYLLEEKNISNHMYKLINSILKNSGEIQRIISNQSQYSDKEVFNELNINIEKIINEKN